MTICAAIRHVTRYKYDRRIKVGPQIIRLRPAPHARTAILAYSLKVSPGEHFLNWQQDPQANWLARVVFPEETDHFSVEVNLSAALNVINPFDFFLEPDAEKFPFKYAPELAEELKPYLQTSKQDEAFHMYMKSIDVKPRRTVEFLFDLNAKLQKDIKYLIRLEPGIQTPSETLIKGSGSCRDSGWLLVQMLRQLGLAARFASGYLIQLTPDVKALDGPSGTTVDFTDLHAWAEVYLPGAGWVGLDPTSGLFAGEGHIPLACTADPQFAAPIDGLIDECEVEFSHEMTVERILETPRVTKPYTDEEWRKIDALGDKVDAALAAGDVRLTMGGEPTFISIDDMNGDEWNTAAVGPTKRNLADTLIRRLRDRFAPDGFLHYGQGKWYPGESLPRWAFALYWRDDGVPVWREADLIARETQNQNVTHREAQRFAAGVARRLDLNPAYAVPAYEDPWHYLAKEQALPENVDPMDSKLEDPEERARLKAVFTRGLRTPVGYVLPVQRWNAEGSRQWRSEQWALRKGRLHLVPGDSPVGFRLPLASLPWVPAASMPFTGPADPFASLTPLPRRDPTRQPFMSGALNTRAWESRVQNVEQQPLTEGAAVRTALSIEPRDGRLCAFMPPVETAADYFDLLAAIEDTAAEMKTAVHVEGYPPPFDPRINVIKVTPDPGVIEVNIHPAKNWREQVAVTEILYEEARQARLTTEKFMLDGRQAGTGGGNHIVVGGKTPGDSPFLRRPDLLRSLVSYWQNHPALSYLFSGMFIGPTSQAPRIDEGRHDGLYEMEIAFQQVPEPGEGWIAPWLTDRIFRNLLIDMTGNTHRSEICIDKLYSPDGPAGRLGLVEFRAFEMPPHARMSLAQQLLLRALIARFWREPYKRPLIRWGTQLHDKFMLPHFVWADMGDVIGEMRDHGFDFDLEWFRAHWYFRFPLCGSVERQGVGLEIRQALEPWHVMGEEGAIGGTVRYVDSSVERLQIRLSNIVEGRHMALVNGRPAPLTPTGQHGEAVAGVRFRAWWPAHCLHPTIAPHVPLTIEVYDSWRKRSMGGCTYHVAHPGGRSFDEFPVNAYEAEGRRLARFEPRGFTYGLLEPGRAERNPLFPMTLDLRRNPEA